MEPPPPKISKILARILGLALFAFGTLSFIPNSLIGEDGYFAANTAHGMLYIFFGLVLLTFTTKGESTAALGLYSTGFLFMILAILGYQALDARPYGKASIFDVILYNRSDLWLDLALTGALILSGRLNTSSKQLLRD